MFIYFSLKINIPSLNIGLSLLILELLNEIGSMDSQTHICFDLPSVVPTRNFITLCILGM